MNVVPFARSHFEQMIVQQRQKGWESLLTDDIFKVLESGLAWTAVDGDEVLACCGMLEVAPGRAVAWAYLSEDIGRRIGYVTKRIKDYLEISPFRRIEMDVDCDFPQAHRWARLLGFDMEAERRKSYTPDGRDCSLYARVKHV